MENVGSELWDSRLYEQLYPGGTVVDKDTVTRLHNELIDTKRVS